MNTSVTTKIRLVVSAFASRVVLVRLVSFLGRVNVVDSGRVGPVALLMPRGRGSPRRDSCLSCERERGVLPTRL